LEKQIIGPSKRWHRAILILLEDREVIAIRGIQKKIWPTNSASRLLSKKRQACMIHYWLISIFFPFGFAADFAQGAEPGVVGL